MLCTSADLMYTGIGRVGFHGNMVTQGSSFFWPNSVIGGFTTRKGTHNVAMINENRSNDYSLDL